MRETGPEHLKAAGPASRSRRRTVLGWLLVLVLIEAVLAALATLLGGNDVVKV